MNAVPADTSSAIVDAATAHIRNFSIIAHVDHGKTTLTDRFIELTTAANGNPGREKQDRVMDSNPIEKERGITIKLAPVRLEHKNHQLNLIDTPGHVDFGYEVERSLAACEGAILLIDASQGIQAQTLSNYEKATKLGLKIIPVLNKIDLPMVDVESCMLDLMETFEFTEKEIIKVSAKTGKNIEAVLDAVVEHVPPPSATTEEPLRALVITSLYNQHKGVIAYVRVVDGELTATNLRLMATDTVFEPNEIGIFSPEMKPVEKLATGEVGYVATGLKEAREVRVGDTVTGVGKDENAVKQLAGYRDPTPMVFMELYPMDGEDYAPLQDAVEKLALHDAAIRFHGTNSAALGNGLHVGFLGMLHAEIVQERLEREFDLELIATAPSVTYEIVTNEGDVEEISSPQHLPDPSEIKEIREPITKAEILVPREHMGAVLQICQDKRGTMDTMRDIGTRLKMTYSLPLAEIVTSFHDELKSATSGFGSLEYQVMGYEPVDAVKISIMVNKEEIEALSVITVREKAEHVGRRLVKKLKEVVPQQLFEIPIQAAIGGKIIARETVRALRKDVTAKLYGGDRTRRMKLLKKQSEGKKRMKSVGSVELNQEAFLAVLERD